MKTKKDLLVPTAITDPAKEVEGLYTPDRLKWESRDLLAGFANHFDMLGKPIVSESGRTVLITKEKPTWLVHPLSTISAASVRIQKDQGSFGYMAEFPAGPWGSVIQAYDDCIDKIEISVDLPRERVLTVFPDGRHWVNPMHKNFFEAIKERIEYLHDVGMDLDDLHLIFFPFAKSVSFYLYPDSAVA